MHTKKHNDKISLPSHILTDIKGITSDSRMVKPNYLFAALAGMTHDGTAYIEEAIKNGATAILSETDMSHDRVTHIPCKNARLAFAKIAARFFQYMPAYIGAVTGTNGKSSVASLCTQLLQAAQYKAAFMGTIGVHSAHHTRPLSHTTPEPVLLHQTLRDLYAHNITHLVMEASSHGLAQYRLDGVDIDVAGFTNLTHDHLDYHHNFSAYRDAKTRLFTKCLSEDGVAVICTTHIEGKNLATTLKAHNKNIICVGNDETADLYIENKGIAGLGYNLLIRYAGNSFECFFPLIGAFQIENLSVALGMAMALSGLTCEAFIPHIQNLNAPPGRMQLVGTHKTGAHLFVDYAHTPDALKHALIGLRAHMHDQGRLHLIFGCGGERDVQKRAQMGEIASHYADHIFITDDNPRHEDAAQIRAQIIANCPTAENIAARDNAISIAINGAEKYDIVLVAGKGHENGQIIGNDIIPFNDADYIRTHPHVIPRSP